MKKIGIISDTHGTFDDKLRHFLQDTDEIWHAGDIGSLALADEIAAFKPLKAVYGNIDGRDVRLVYPRFQHFKCEETDVLMTHIGGYPGRYERAAEVQIGLYRPALFISGHSHILKVMFDKKKNVLHINPGAAGRYGFHQVRTAVRLEIDGNNICNLEVGEWERG